MCGTRLGTKLIHGRPKIDWKKKLPWLHIFMIWRLISIIGLICYDKLWQTINVWSIEDVRPLCFSTTLVRCLLINTSKGLVCWLTHLSTAHKQCAVCFCGPPLIGTPEKVWYFASSIRTSLTRGAITWTPPGYGHGCQCDVILICVNWSLQSFLILRILQLRLCHSDSMVFLFCVQKFEMWRSNN